jgi:hypothetical protein
MCRRISPKPPGVFWSRYFEDVGHIDGGNRFVCSLQDDKPTKLYDNPSLDCRTILPLTQHLIKVHNEETLAPRLRRTDHLISFSLD